MAESLSEFTCAEFGVITSTPKAFKLSGKITNGSDFDREWEFWVPKSLVNGDEEEFIPQFIIDQELEKAEAYFGDKAQMLVPSDA